MTANVMKELLSKCAGCGKSHYDVRSMVALTDSIHICNECVDVCSEIVHEESGFVKIALSELENLRKQAQQARLARIWIDGVRESIARADDELERQPDADGWIIWNGGAVPP